MPYVTEGQNTWFRPSPAEIRAATAQIREHWTPRERATRGGYASSGVRLATFNRVLVGGQPIYEAGEPLMPEESRQALAERKRQRGRESAA